MSNTEKGEIGEPEVIEGNCSKRNRYIAAFLMIPLPIIIGFIISQTTSRGFDMGIMNQPAFQPPNWAFSVVWSTIYLLLGTSLYLVFEKWGCEGKLTIAGYSVFGIQLAINYTYTPVATVVQSVYGSTAIVVFLLLFVPVNIGIFWKLRPVSGALLLPYQTWLTVATALSFEIINLNPGQT